MGFNVTLSSVEQPKVSNIPYLFEKETGAIIRGKAIIRGRRLFQSNQIN